ncbi:MAG: phosphatase PAP2 family protein [Clostridia bacterium]|nr:phosphatase PAP2 family protein [Clostridia bacterium]
MKEYAAFYEKQTAFLKRLKNPAKVLSITYKVLTIAVAAIYLAGLIIAAFGVFGSPLPTLFSLLLPPAVAVIVVTLLRMAIPRKRPYEEEGGGITPLVKKERKSNSFPSRHTACAFVIGVTLCSVALWLGLPVLALGALLAYVRFLCGFHYPTDLIGGALIGATFGVAAFFLPLLFI